ncbi:NLRC3, partial [Symbiodinium microadriaticum]
MTPEAFEAQVKEGGLLFSHEEDAKLVKQLQLEVFRHKAKSIRELRLSSLGEREVETAMETLQHYTGLQTLEITNCKLPVQLPDMLKAIMQTQIVALSLDHSGMDDRSARALAEALEQNKALKSLSLGKNNIKDGVRELVKAMEVNQELTKLDISENDIGPSALAFFKNAKGRKREVIHRDVAFFMDAEEAGDAEYQKADSLSLLLTSCDVIPAIGKLQQLTSLSLDMKARAIQDAGCIALAEALAQLRQLQSVTLNLRSNEIGDEGCRGLAEVLRHAPRLTTMNLHLDNNQINNTGCLVWAVNLREMQQLTSMRVSFRGNPEISGEAWAVWLEAVGNLRRLRNVTLVSLRRRTIEASPKALKGVVGHLRELYLASASRHHKAGASVCSTLAGALSQLQQLRSLGLDVADNFVDDLGCTALADALGKLQWLTTISLDMSCNCIRDAGFSALSLALRRLRQLKHVTLNLRSNCMGDAGCRDLAKVLGQLPELSSLSLDIGFNTWRKDIALTTWTQTLSQLRNLAFLGLSLEKRSKSRHLLLQRELGKNRWAALYTAFGLALGKLQRVEILHLSLRGAIGSAVGCTGLVKALGSL